MILLAGLSFSPSPKVMASLGFVNGKSFFRTKFRFCFPGWRDSAKLARFGDVHRSLRTKRSRDEELLARPATYPVAAFSLRGFGAARKFGERFA
jgi:hypothetical protein